VVLGVLCSARPHTSSEHTESQRLLPWLLLSGEALECYDILTVRFDDPYDPDAWRARAQDPGKRAALDEARADARLRRLATDAAAAEEVARQWRVARGTATPADLAGPVSVGPAARETWMTALPEARRPSAPSQTSVVRPGARPPGHARWRCRAAALLRARRPDSPSPSAAVRPCTRSNGVCWAARHWASRAPLTRPGRLRQHLPSGLCVLPVVRDSWRRGARASADNLRAVWRRPHRHRARRRLGGDAAGPPAAPVRRGGGWASRAAAAGGGTCSGRGGGRHGRIQQRAPREDAAAAAPGAHGGAPLARLHGNVSPTAHTWHRARRTWDRGNRVARAGGGAPGGLRVQGACRGSGGWVPCWCSHSRAAHQVCRLGCECVWEHRAWITIVGGAACERMPAVRRAHAPETGAP